MVADMDGSNLKLQQMPRLTFPDSTDLHSYEDGMWGADKCLSGYFLLIFSPAKHLCCEKRKN